jgi:hypothetical protein
VKKLLVVPILLVFAFAFPAFADPGPADEVEVILGNCEDGTTILRAHNTQEIELGWLIRIDGKLVDQGRLAPGERVERTYEVALGESHFYRIRLGLQGEGRYFSTEGTADRTNCESESPPPSETQTPPPSETQTPPPTETQTPSVGGGGGNSNSPSVLGGSETRSPGSGGTAFTGPEVGWLIAAGLGLLLLGAAALRFTAGSTR